MEENVVFGIAGGELAADFGGKVVVNVFGFPPAVSEVEDVEQGAVQKDSFVALELKGEFGDERPLELAGAGSEQRLEGRANGGFVGNAEFLELAESDVERLDGFVRRFDVQLRH